MLRFSCPRCKTVLSAAEEKARLIVRCPKCKGQMRVPAAVAARRGELKPSGRLFRAWLAVAGLLLVAGLATGLVWANNQFQWSQRAPATKTPPPQKIAKADIKKQSKNPRSEKAPVNREIPSTKPKSNPTAKKTADKPAPETNPPSIPMPEPAPQPQPERPIEPKPVPQPQPKHPIEPEPTPQPQPKHRKETEPPAKPLPPPPPLPAPPPPPRGAVKPVPPNAVVQLKPASDLPMLKAKPDPFPKPKPQPQPPKTAGKQPSKDFTRSPQEIKAALDEIAKQPVTTNDPMERERELALRRLKAYRYLAGLPYKHVTLDAKMNEYAQAAAEICKQLGRLDHRPKNPGWPEAKYEIARTGAMRSNLAGGGGRLTIAKTVDMYMFDSDRFNIDRVGHRRWCISPFMSKTGFGKAGGFSAMYTFDRSYPKAFDFDFIAWPPRGYLPIEFFSVNHAWSVTLNPKNYRLTASGIKPNIYRADETGVKTGEPLKLNYNQIDRGGFGYIPHCIIFRPEPSSIAANRRYVVEIEGLRKADGTPHTLRYGVEFVR